MASSKLKTILLGAVAVGAASTAVPAAAVNIVLNPDASFANQPNGAQALFAFQRAANFWNSFLTGRTEIRFNVSYRALAANVIAQAGSTRADAFASDVYDALASHGTTALDGIAQGGLVPLTAAGGVRYRMPESIPAGQTAVGTHFGLDTAAASIVDNDDTFNNLALYANTSNLRELGFTVDAQGRSLDVASDASITFSSAFNFDFDPTDGISVGTQDFISVAVHEMGHALGFVSGTDFYDFYGGNPAAGGVRGPGFETGLVIDWDQESVLSVWDLFRRSTNGGDAGFDPTTGERYIQLDPNRGAAFSIDGENFFNQNNSAEAGFANLSTGRYNGDGQQASHWKDETGFTQRNGCFTPDRQIGIMDPTSGSCQLGIVTANDLAAFDAMGYNLNFDITKNRGFAFTSADIYRLAVAPVPEPATWGMMIVGVGLVGGSLRRRRTAVRTAVSFG